MRGSLGRSATLGSWLGASLVASACYQGQPHASDESAAEGDSGTAADDDGAGSSDTGSDGETPEPADDACGPGSADPLRRLTNSQYLRSVTMLTGLPVPVGLAQQLPPVEAPEHGFDNAAEKLVVRQADVNTYQRVAEAMAAARFVSGDDDPAAWVGCTPTADGCLADWVHAFGRLAFRRPLTELEHGRIVTLAEGIADAEADPWAPFAVAMEAMLQSPKFLLVVEPSGDDVDAPLDLDAYQIATRLALALWGQSPDAALLDLARDGGLDTAEGRVEVVQQMLSDERAEDGLMELANALFEVEAVDGADFVNPPEGHSAEALRTAARAEVEALLRSNLVRGDLREVYTSRQATLTPALADLYGVSQAAVGGDAIEVEFDAASERGGLFGTAAFLAVHASGENASGVRRGAFVRRVALCSEPPPPPPEVEMGDGTTDDHGTQPACWGCHAMLDPVGWGLDRYGPSGELRQQHPDGTPVRDDGYFNEAPDTTFGNAPQLGEAVVAAPTFARCATKRTLQWVLGKSPIPHKCLIDDLTASFETGGYQAAGLIEALVVDPVFLHRTVPELEMTDDDE